MKRPTPKHCVLFGTFLATALGVSCVVSNWGRLAATIDEANHVATGLEWWQHGRFTLWTETPPLLRAAVAVGPWLGGARLPPSERLRGRSFTAAHEEGSVVLHRDGRYERNLAQARAGVLPFLLLGLLFTALLAGRDLGWPAAATAVAMTATLPPLLAHSALATTDAGFAAVYVGAVWGIVRALDRPSQARLAVAGALLGVALLAKFLTLIFLPPTLLALWIARRTAATASAATSTPLPWRAWAARLGVGALVCAGVVWAGYRFSIGQMRDLPSVFFFGSVLPAAGTPEAAAFTLASKQIPAPELLHGLLAARLHALVGHGSYLFGQESNDGFALFYPVALLVKAPLAFLMLAGVGIAVILRRLSDPNLTVHRAALLAAIGIVVVLATGKVNLGVRHALTVYLLLAVSAAGGWIALLRASEGRRRRCLMALVTALLICQTVVCWHARHNLLAFFNVLAGQDPARILVGSDLDWGQDVLPLAREVRRRGIKELHVALYGDAALLCDRFGARLNPLPVRSGVVKGWVAVSENYLRKRRALLLNTDPCDASRGRGRRRDLPPYPFAWLHDHAAAQVRWEGRAIRLYNLE